jgi:dynein heavy chain 1, cytosolic
MHPVATTVCLRPAHTFCNSLHCSTTKRRTEAQSLRNTAHLTGTILEDDTVVLALEALKRETGEVAQEVERTQAVMSEVQSTSDAYLPLARAVARMFFAMEALSSVHYLYQFSLQFYLDILSGVLAQSAASSGSTVAAAAAAARLQELKSQLFAAVAQRVTRALLHDDKLVFTLRLAQIYLETDTTTSSTSNSSTSSSGSSSSVYWDALLQGAAAVTQQTSTSDAPPVLAVGSAALTQQQSRDVAALCTLPAYAPLRDNLQQQQQQQQQQWSAFMTAAEPETAVPAESLWLAATPAATTAAVAKPSTALLRLLLVSTLRPDRALAAATAFIAATLGSAFPWQEPLDLEAVACASGPARGPILLCSEPGHDASWRVDALARERSAAMASVAMGSAEGYEAAERAVTAAARSGTWVLLRNIHLCPGWLSALEQRLHALPTHPATRLFLTAEVHASLPPSLLRASELLTVEAPTGVRANVLRYLAAVPKAADNSSSSSTRGPAERHRLHALLAWLHAVVTERLRYAPLGWARRYEFGEADAACALAVADSWLDSVTPAGAAHVRPEAIPWGALRALLCQSVYGGRIDNASDQALMESFVSALFTPAAFDVDFALCSSSSSSSSSDSAATAAQGDAPQQPLVTLSDATTHEGFVRWAEALPHSNSPAWLGLQETAESALLLARGQAALSRLLQLQDSFDDDAPLVAAAAAVAVHSSSSSHDAVHEPPAAAVAAAVGNSASDSIAALAQRWLSALPQQLNSGAFAREAASADALHRCMCRELARGAALLARVRTDLALVTAVCRGSSKPTNEARALIGCLAKGVSPDRWTRGYVTADVTAAAFIADLCKRLQHLESLAVSTAVPTVKRYWLGGLFNPEAFVTATRQYVAQQQGCSLECLASRFAVGDSSGCSSDITSSSSTFLITGMALEGAGWSYDDQALCLSAAYRTPLALSKLTWAVVSSDSTASTTASSSTSSNSGTVGMALPLYLHGSRSTLIAEVQLARPVAVPAHVWLQRGVALVAWNPK